MGGRGIKACHPLHTAREGVDIDRAIRPDPRFFGRYMAVKARAGIEALCSKKF
jgi:hypothetical protein